MTASTVETLYYRLYNFVLLGDSQNAQMYLEMLRDEYVENESAFDILKQDNRFEHLQQLGYAVDNGLVVKNFDYTDNNEDVEDADKDEDQADTEKELVKTIFANDENVKQLQNLLNATDSFSLYNLEHPTKYGRVDVVVQDDMTMYVIEIKKSQARYSVISQIDKYMLDFRLYLNLKMWNNVIGVVIANGFLNRVTKELVKLGVIPIKYTLRKGKISFRKLYVKKKSDNS